MKAKPTSASPLRVEMMLLGYLEAAKGDVRGEDDDEGPSTGAFAPAALDRARDDCRKFLECEKYPALREFLDTLQSEDRLSALGSDFWLTRAGHGAGFWDGDWDGDWDIGWPNPDLDESVGETLTAWTDEFPRAEVYEGDDGKIYLTWDEVCGNTPFISTGVSEADGSAPRMMTSEEYVSAKGNFCPRCRSPVIECVSGFDFESENGEGAQTMTCTVCNFRWVESYALTGFISATTDELTEE